MGAPVAIKWCVFARSWLVVLIDSGSLLLSTNTLLHLASHTSSEITVYAVIELILNVILFLDLPN